MLGGSSPPPGASPSRDYSEWSPNHAGHQPRLELDQVSCARCPPARCSCLAGTGAHRVKYGYDRANVGHQPGEGNWPPPDDLDLDLNNPPGPHWLEATAERVRFRRSADAWPAVIGHCDWESHNLGRRDGHIAVAYDWDSLGSRSDPAIAGAAATVFASAPGGPVAADLGQTDAFLDAYRKGRPSWNEHASELAYAAGLWVLLYNARKELAGGGAGYLEHLNRELQARLERAGA